LYKCLLNKKEQGEAMKRRYLHRNDWKRIVSREYKELQIDEEGFYGYISLLKMKEVSQPLVVKYLEKEICIADHQYSWLYQLPLNEHFAITTMFDSHNNIIQWYIDITYKNGIKNGEAFMDDLFLDIIVLPTGEIIEKDQDELQVALENNIITREQYELAFNTFHQVLNQIQTNTFPYFTLATKHFQKLNHFAKLQ
jgi:uncharacterized protein